MPTPRTGLAAWGRKFVPDYFPAPPSGFHSWLVPELESLQGRRGQRRNMVAPRGAAKSTWVSFAYPLWAAVEEREPYILLLSDTGDQAKKYLESIRQELESNAALEKAYPVAFGVGPVWQQHRIRLRNGVVIEALGTGAKIRGRKNRASRPTLVVIDDPQNNEHITSPIQRERSWEWLTREVMEVGQPDTNFLALGTALHRECIVMRLLETAGWRSRVFRSIIAWPERLDLWDQWEAVLHDHQRADPEADALAYYEAHRAGMDRGAEVLWPEREPLYALMLKRAAIGKAAFEGEKQSNPVSPDTCEWPADYFDHGAFWFDAWPAALTITVLTLDPSKGKNAKRGDYSAFVRVGADAAGVIYIDADLRRRDVAAIAADGVEHCLDWKPEGFGVEINQFQELLMAPFATAAATRGATLPLYGITNVIDAKATRIRRLTPLLAQKRLRVKRGSPGAALLVRQLQDFPNGDHDDGPDALEMGVRLIGHLQASRQRRAVGRNDGIQAWRA